MYTTESFKNDELAVTSPITRERERERERETRTQANDKEAGKETEPTADVVSIRKHRLPQK